MKADCSFFHMFLFPFSALNNIHTFCLVFSVKQFRKSFYLIINLAFLASNLWMNNQWWCCSKFRIKNVFCVFVFFLHLSCWQLIATVAHLKLFSNLSLKWIFFQLLFKLLFTCQLKTSINPSNSKNNQKKNRTFFRAIKIRRSRASKFSKKNSVVRVILWFLQTFSELLF